MLIPNACSQDIILPAEQAGRKRQGRFILIMTPEKEQVRKVEAALGARTLERNQPSAFAAGFRTTTCVSRWSLLRSGPIQDECSRR